MPATTPDTKVECCCAIAITAEGDSTARLVDIMRGDNWMRIAKSWSINVPSEEYHPWLLGQRVPASYCNSIPCCGPFTPLLRITDPFSASFRDDNCTTDAEMKVMAHKVDTSTIEAMQAFTGSHCSGAEKLLTSLVGRVEICSPRHPYLAHYLWT